MTGNSTKVAFFTLSLQGGGAERAMVQLAAGMARRGMLVDLVVAHAKGPYVGLVPDDVRLVDLNVFRIEVSHLSLLRYLKSARPEALFSVLVDPDVVALAVRRFLYKDFKLIVRVATTMSLAHAQSATIKQRAAFALWRRLLPSADAVAGVSSGVIKDLRRYVPSVTDRVHTIYDPVVGPHIAQQASAAVQHPWFDDAPPVIVSVGRLELVKGHETTLRALAEVVESRPARLLILGDGPDHDRLLDVARSLQISHLVDFVGFQSNPFAYMARAALFVLASSREGLSNGLLEAMACGTPVVSTDCPNGPSEILERGKWGRLVPVGDWRALAAAILNTLDAPVDRQKLVARARDFDVETSVDRHMELLAELTQTARHRQ